MAVVKWMSTTLLTELAEVTRPVVCIGLNGSARMRYDEGWVVVPMSLEPIMKKVYRYYCPLCGKGKWNRSDVRKHMMNCWRNPEARSCGTCQHFKTDDDYHGDYCELGIQFRVFTPETRIIRQCSRWAPP